MTALDESAFARDWKIGCTRAEMAALHGYTNLNAVTKVARRLGLPHRQNVKNDLIEKGLALTGGHWAPDSHGVQRWIPDGAVA